MNRAPEVRPQVSPWQAPRVAERSRGLVPSAERAPEVRHIPRVGLGVEILFAIRDGEL